MKQFNNTNMTTRSEGEKRIIKFRAWDKQRKEMFQVQSLNTYSDRDNSKPFQVRRYQSDLPEDFELMQFTGLLDKNGKEIYEGDVLTMKIPISINGTHTHNVEIFSQGYAFWFKTIIYPGYTDCLWFHYNASQREIIGNIYEHPDLLTPNQNEKK
jgi:uncharacterized phage protein (TIGR01671 family)